MEKSPSFESAVSDRKKNITVSALKAFCEKGYDNATVDDIVKKAGCSHGLFYHYFTSKKAVFEEAMKIKHDHDNHKLKDRVDKEPSCREKLRIIINTMFDDMKNDENFPYHYFLFVYNCFNNKEKFPSVRKKPKHKKHFHQVLTEIFELGQKNGEFTTTYSPKDCSTLFLSIIQGATLGYVISPKEIQTKMKLPNTNLILDVFSKGETK